MDNKIRMVSITIHLCGYANANEALISPMGFRLCLVDGPCSCQLSGSIPHNRDIGAHIDVIWTTSIWTVQYRISGDLLYLSLGGAAT